jgi:hypothetical protein
VGFGSFVSGAWHATENFFDPDTSVPAGTDPAQIYQWFHHGPGTGSYQNAASALQPAVGSMKNYRNYLNQAQQALSAGWSGPAADAAQQSFGPINTSAQSVAAHADSLHTHLAAQISQFNDTKGKVVNVPTTPPSGPGLVDYIGMATPVGAAGVVSADISVANYQSDAHGNQQAYQGYQGPTNTQSAGLPQGEGQKQPPSNNPPVTAPPSGNQVQLSGNAPGAYGSQGHGQLPNRSGNYPGANGMQPGSGANPNWPGLGQNNANGLGNSGTSAQGYAAPSVAPAPGAGHAGGFGPSGGSPSGGAAMGGFGGGYGPTGGSGASASPAGGMGAGAAGARGMGSPRMGGGRRQADKEHKTAGYLQENDPDAIFGTDQKTVPPVIGG